ncbi:MAG: LuxR C-terminal-related transcriptional regulator, partial [Proteobacteria bacterium]|nr:LuxR C-terminal-related transcriptional regulator [Pseudomonadota bacterium]
ILDIRMPTMSGLEVQQELANHGIDLPIVFLTGHGDVHLAVRAMKAGAFDFIEKPYNDQVLLDLIQRAISRHGENRESVSATDAIQGRWERLTPRERQIMNQVVDGKSNRVIAEMLEISEKTIEFHRANVMEKMEATSLAELIRLAVSLERIGRDEPQGLPKRNQEVR